MKKRLLSLLLSVVMILGMLPVSTMATEPETVYISVSDDGAYLDHLAYAAVPLSELEKIDLADYGLSDYQYDADSDETYDITALHLVIYAHTELLGKKWNEVSVSGGPGSIFFETGLFGFADCNMNYYFNGVFPTDAYGTGITADQLVLSDGDFLDYAHFSGWSFYSDSAAGFHYFLDADDKITHTYTATAGEALTVTLGRAASDLFNGGTLLSHENPSYYIDKDHDPLPIRYSKTLYASDAASAALDANGQASITFGEAGTYYLWADGGYGYDFAGEVVSSPAYAEVNVEEAVKPETSITVPANAEVTVSYKSSSGYNYKLFTTLAAALKEENSDGTVTYYYEAVNNKDHNYRVSGSDYVTYVGTFKKKSGTPVSITVTEAQLAPVGKDQTSVDRTLTSNGGSNVADVFLNINAQGYLKLSTDETKQLIPLRSWQAIKDNSYTGNYFIEPDYHYTVVNENGEADSSVVTISKDGLITPQGEGTAIVLVSYDAMTYCFSSKDEFFGALWPENTGVFVVSVGAEDSSIDTGMTINIEDGKNFRNSKLAGNALDAEMDVIYFLGENGSYTFTPGTEGVTVTVANPTVTDTMTFSGFTAEGVTTENGAVTVPLTEGRNIVKLEKDGKAEYQVITAKALTVTINDGKAVEPGDTVSVTFETIYHPANKLAGIYNSTAGAVYTTPDGKLVGTVSGGGTGVYNVASNIAIQTLNSYVTRNEAEVSAWGTTQTQVTYALGNTISVPSNYTEEEFVLTGGAVVAVGNPYSSEYGKHREVTREKGQPSPNSTTVSKEAYFGMLPDLVIPVNLTTYTVTLPTGEGYTAADADGSASPVTEGGSYSFTVTVADGYDGTNMTVKANGNTLTATNGIYTISNITADQTITVDGVEEIEEEVTLTWQEVMAKTRAFLIAQAEETAPVVNTNKGEWMVLGLARNGLEADFFEDYYDNVVAYVQENIDPSTGRLHESKSTDNSRVIVALTALGKDVTNVAGYDLLQGLTDTDYVAKQGVNGPIWALIALDTGSYELPSNAVRSNQVTRQWLIEYILGKQLSDGGWALAGTASDPDMTGMAVQALAPYYDDNDAVKVAVDEAISAMASMIGRSSPEGCAQIIVALSALGIDCEEDEAFANVLDRMLTYALEDGSFRKSPDASNFNQMSTEQAFYALVAYDRLRNGDTSLYDMSDVIPSEEEQDAPVQEVIDAIDALTVTRANASTLRKLEKIRTAYQALSPEERALVENYADFEEKSAAFDELLEAAKEDAAEELNAYIEDLEEDDYTEAEWEELEEILSAALRELRSAETTEQINTILSQAQRKMDNLETGDAIRVSFRLIGDSKHDDGVDGHEEYVTWIPTTSYTLKPGATMYDVFTAAISDHGLSQRGASNNYVESIKAPSVLGGYWLGEFDNGPNSGWMYTVNGEHPGTGLETYDLEDGDRIVWHYTDDYLLEERSSSSKYYYRWLEAKDISPKEYAGEHKEEETEKEISSTDFVDVKESDWFYKDVTFAVDQSLFTGTSETTFSPYSSMTRGMLVTVLYRLAGEPAVSGGNTFSDVPAGQWYSKAVAWAEANGIVGGYGSGLFGTNDNVTREQMAAILYRYAEYKKLNVSASNSLTDYEDFSDISAYALKSLQWANGEKLINGRTDTTLAPKGTATRAEVAAILHRFVENVVND